MLLSVIVPCYNESQGIFLTYQTLNALLSSDSVRQTYDYEIIFINDGSRDQTLLALKEITAEESRCHYISFSRNFGKEAAMFAGLSYASGDAVVIMDADLQHPPELIPEMVQYFAEGYDQVIAQRDRSGEKLQKAFSAKLYYRLVNHLVDVEMADGVGDFRLLSRKAVKAVLSMKEYNRFSKGIFSWIGFKQKVIRYENRERAVGTTKWSFKRLLSYGIDGILSFNNKPLRICFWLGGLLVAASFLYVLTLLVGIFIHGVDVPGYFTTICVISLIGGAQLISVGILGEYVGRIYYEVKKRPVYLVSETDIPDAVDHNK